MKLPVNSGIRPAEKAADKLLQWAKRIIKWRERKMEVIKKGALPEGTSIQIENWHKDYGFMPYASTIAAYPKSKMTHEGAFAPKAGVKFRCSFEFETNEETEAAYDALLSGNKSLADYRNKMQDRLKYGDCI